MAKIIKIVGTTEIPKWNRMPDNLYDIYFNADYITELIPKVFEDGQKVTRIDRKGSKRSILTKMQIKELIQLIND